MALSNALVCDDGEGTAIITGIVSFGKGNACYFLTDYLVQNFNLGTYFLPTFPSLKVAH